MTTTSYWLADAGPAHIAPSWRSNEPVEVAVVGGGVTGWACALDLARAGRRVRVYEARTVASGGSGRNGGFALRGAAPPYDRLRARVGADAAAALWRLTERALEQLEELAGDAFVRVGSLRLAADLTERDDLRAEYEALRADGLDASWRDELDAPLRGRFHGALLHPGDGALQPVLWVRRLAAAAIEAGAELAEGVRVDALDALPADEVVIATDGYTGGLVPDLDRSVESARGQILVTEPLPRRLFACPHYARHGFDYWQQLRDGRLLVGGWRDASFETEATAVEETTPLIQSRIEEFTAQLLGTPPAVAHRWAGIFGVTRDGLPLVGPLPGRDGVWAACGYCGHGNVLGLASGRLVAQAILGRAAPELEVLDPGRLLPAARRSELDPR